MLSTQSVEKILKTEGKAIKSEFEKRNDERCIHRHTRESHPSCFRKGALARQFWYKNLKMGFLDIETTDFKVNKAFILSWAIKEREGPVVFDVVDRKEIFDFDFDKRVTKNLVDEINKYDILVTYYGCVTPGHKVLLSDLTWKNVEDLKEGDILLAFDEEAPEDKRARQFKKSTVINNIPLKKEVFEIVLSNGKKLYATGDHPWLVRRNGIWTWRKTTELIHFNSDHPTMSQILDVWEPNVSYEAGYLSGFVDGEGSVVQEIEIISVTSVGEQLVCGLETSSKTYIVDGFGSHNTGFDIPFMRTRSLLWEYDFPVYGQVYHFDLYYRVRNLLKLHRNSLDAATRFFEIEGKNHLDIDTWHKAAYGHRASLAYVLDHNVNDVIILEGLFDKLEVYSK